MGPPQKISSSAEIRPSADDMSCLEKLQVLKSKLAGRGCILVSFSGGVDSGLLAKVACDVLGDKALSVLLDSKTLPRSERKAAEELAGSLGLNLLVADGSAIMQSEEFARNPSNRCYICKKCSCKVLKKIAEQRGIVCIADGANLSDLQDYRPGIQASDEDGIWHPFAEAGMTKEEIRETARAMGLPFWDKPSSACLASRIPYGEEITEEKLRRVEEAEELLKCMGFGELRVRAHGRLARIELSPKDLKRALSCRERIAETLKAVGFQYVTLDLEGFRSGSMNEVL
jgi:uncharacterized protein